VLEIQLFKSTYLVGWVGKKSSR